MAGLSVGFFTLEYANPKDVVSQLDTLLSDESGNPMKGIFRFVPVESARSVLVVSPQEKYLCPSQGLDRKAGCGRRRGR
jgi:general secretion pathway protein D